MSRAREPSLARSLPIALSVALAAPGCTLALLSAPRGEAHLDAMAEGARDHSAGRDAEAAEAYGRAAESAERRVDRDEAEYREAQALRRLERWTEALVHFDAIAERRPISRRTLRAAFEAARLRLEHVDREAGLLALERFCIEHPDDGQASHALAILLRELDDDDADLALLDRVGEAASGTELDDDVHMDRAERLLARGDREGARAAFEHVVTVERYPLAQRWDNALTRLADMAEEDGEPRGAIAYLERMLLPHSDGIAPGTYTQEGMPIAALRIARIYRDALHDPAAAETAFRRMIDEFGTSRLRDDALVELGELYLGGDRRDDACATFRRVVSEYERGHARRAADEHLVADCGERAHGD